MVGQNRTKEFLEYIRVKTKSSTNSSTPKPTRTNDKFEDSIIIATGKQMLFSIKQMDAMISENQSKYLDLNRFLNTTTPTPNTHKTFKYPHHSTKHNRIWSEDDRYKFENQILIFIKDTTSQNTKLTQLLDSSDLKTDHDYIGHQKNILKCLRSEVSSLSDRFQHLIKARSKALHAAKPKENKSNIKKKKEEEELDEFVDDIMNKQMFKNMEIQKPILKNSKDIDLSVLEEEEEKYGDMNRMEITKWEIQEFKRENEEMVKMLEEEHKEVVMAEQKTAEIVELLSLFTEQVINQDAVVQNIDTAISGSLEDLEGGNKELDKAQKRGKETRTVFMTVVLTLAFSLWFLDWYKS